MAGTLALATVMPPEPAPLNFGSPRVKAAMRVLGIAERDIEKCDKDRFDGEIAYELFERKRRSLIQNVHFLAKDSPEAGSVPGAVIDSSYDPNAAFMAEVIAIEKRNMEKMNTMAKKDVQSMMIKELEGQKAARASKDKQEESKKRQIDLLKERDEEMKKRSKEAQKKLEKSQEVRVRAEKALKDEAKELQKKIDEKAEAVDAKLQQIADGRIDGRVRAQEKRDQALERKENFENKLWNMREQNYDQLLKREDAVSRRLGEMLSDSRNNSAIFKEKLDGCTQRAREHLEKRQAEREEGFRKREGEHAHAREVRETNAKEALKGFKDRNKKERQNFESRYERVLKERETIEPSRRLARTQSDFASQGCHARPEYHHSMNMHKSMVDLVEFNRGLLRRAHAYHQEQELQKIANMRGKVKALLDSRAIAGQRRMAMIKNVSIAKHELNFQVERAKNAPPSKMNKILGSMDPDPEAASRINELLASMNMELLPGTKLEGEEDR